MSTKEQKRILVTGEQVLGSHLCESLIEEGCYVICADNFFTGQKSNISNLLSDSNFELIQHDIILPLEIEVDEIYNLACPASPVHYQYDPVKTIKTAVLGAINMLELARKTEQKYFKPLLLKFMEI